MFTSFSCVLCLAAGFVIWSSRARSRCRRTGWSIYRDTSWTRRFRTRARPWWRSPAFRKTQTHTRTHRRLREAGRPEWRSHAQATFFSTCQVTSGWNSSSGHHLAVMFSSLTRPFLYSVTSSWYFIGLIYWKYSDFSGDQDTKTQLLPQTLDIRWVLFKE